MTEGILTNDSGVRHRPAPARIAQLLKVHREEILRLAAVYAAQDGRLVGSFVRNETTESQ